MLTTPAEKAKQMYEKYENNKGLAITEVLKLIKNNPLPNYWIMVKVELDKME